MTSVGENRLEQAQPARRIRLPLGWMPPVLTLAGLVALWEAASVLCGIPQWLLPAPSAIWAAGAAVPFSQWWSHIWATLSIVLAGFAAAFAVGFPLAMAITRFPLFRSCVYPILVIVQSTPVVAVAPILVVTLGATEAPRIVITAMITFFPLVVGIATGLGRTPEELVELSRSLGAGETRQFLQVRLPAAMPYVFSATRVAITLAVIGAVVAEFVAAERGLGYFIRSSTSFFRVPLAFAALGVLVAMSLVLFQLVGLVQRIFFPHSLPRA